MAVTLTKEERIRFETPAGDAEDILLHLRWSQTPPPKKKRFYTRKPRPIDLDFGCLFELENGEKGCVQTLGNAFGTLQTAPYVALESGERRLTRAKGERLRIRSAMLPNIRRLLLFTFVYEGLPNWRQAKPQLSLRFPEFEEITLQMDEYEDTQRTCALALLENQKDGSFAVEKLLQFFDGHSKMDQGFGWGLRWTPGRR